MSYRRTETETAMEHLSDHELMEAYVHGSDKAFETLYARYRRKLYIYAYSLLKGVPEAQDAMHEVFAKLISNTRAFSQAANISAFLFAACRNYCINRLKSRKYRQAELPEFAVLKTAGPVHEAARHEEAQLLNGIIAQLPREQREVLVLKVFSGLTFAQVAETTGQPQGTVATRYRLALARIKSALQTQER